MSALNVSNPNYPTPGANPNPGAAPVPVPVPARAAVGQTGSVPGAPRPKSSPQTQIIRNTTQYGVLVVSRTPAVVAAVEDLLLRAGETVFLAKDFYDAWNNIKLGRIGMVVLDCTQPSADEMNLLSTVRSLPATSDVSFLFLKDKATQVPLLPIEGDDRYHDEWLDYPCTLQEIAVLVTRLLQQRALSRRLKAQQSPASGSSAKLGASDSSDTAALSGVQPGILGGKLGELDVPKLLAMLAPMYVTGVLTVRSDAKRKGQIHLVNGAVWHATFNGVKGTDALTILLRFNKGKFSFDTAEPPPERSITGNTMGLLLDRMREQDETQALVQQAKRASGGVARPM